MASKETEPTYSPYIPASLLYSPAPGRTPVQKGAEEVAKRTEENKAVEEQRKAQEVKQPTPEKIQASQVPQLTFLKEANTPAAQYLLAGQQKESLEYKKAQEYEKQSQPVLPQLARNYTESLGPQYSTAAGPRIYPTVEKTFSGNVQEFQKNPNAYFQDVARQMNKGIITGAASLASLIVEPQRAIPQAIYGPIQLAASSDARAQLAGRAAKEPIAFGTELGVQVLGAKAFGKGFGALEEAAGVAKYKVTPIIEAAEKSELKVAGPPAPGKGSITEMALSPVRDRGLRVLAPKEVEKGGGIVETMQQKGGYLISKKETLGVQTGEPYTMRGPKPPEDVYTFTEKSRTIVYGKSNAAGQGVIVQRYSLLTPTRVLKAQPENDIFTAQGFKASGKTSNVDYLSGTSTEATAAKSVASVARVAEEPRIVTRVTARPASDPLKIVTREPTRGIVSTFAATGGMNAAISFLRSVQTPKIRSIQASASKTDIVSTLKQGGGSQSPIDTIMKSMKGIGDLLPQSQGGITDIVQRQNQDVGFPLISMPKLDTRTITGSLSANGIAGLFGGIGTDQRKRGKKNLPGPRKKKRKKDVWFIPKADPASLEITEIALFRRGRGIFAGARNPARTASNVRKFREKIREGDNFAFRFPTAQQLGGMVSKSGRLIRKRKKRIGG